MASGGSMSACLCGIHSCPSASTPDLQHASDFCGDMDDSAPILHQNAVNAYTCSNGTWTLITPSIEYEAHLVNLRFWGPLF